VKISDLAEVQPPPMPAPYEPDKSLVWESGGVFYRYNECAGKWVPITTPGVGLADLLVDIAKKLEKTNILLARIENAVQCIDESLPPKL
jgi:hypothetical protein